jgi:hypothetical protein
LTEQDDPAAAVERLERALERIAALAATGAARNLPSPSMPALAPGLAETDMHEMAERLDQLIAQLRAALGTPAGS